MSLVIASQFEEGLNDALRAHSLKPHIIPAPEDEPWAVAGDVDILLARPTPAWRSNRTLPRPEGWPGKLQWVLSGSAGVDSYPRWLLDAPIVTCGRGVGSEEIADYVIAAIYLQAKDLESARARSRDEWVKHTLGSVGGSTVGIIGLGAIGSAVARKAIGLGAEVVAVRRRILPSPIPGVRLASHPAEVVAAADHLVIAAPSTDETRKLVDAALLAHAKPTAHLINIARGAVVDQDALVAALDDGRLGFATLDVTDPEPLPEGHVLWTHPKVRLTPHISSNVRNTRHRMLDKIAADLSRFASGESPSDVVDPIAGY